MQGFSSMFIIKEPILSGPGDERLLSLCMAAMVISFSVTLEKVFCSFSVIRRSAVSFSIFCLWVLSKSLLVSFLSMWTSLKMLDILASSNVYSSLLVYLKRGSTMFIVLFPVHKFVVPMPELLIIFRRVQIFSVKHSCFSFSTVNQLLGMFFTLLEVLMITFSCPVSKHFSGLSVILVCFCCLFHQDFTQLLVLAIPSYCSTVLFMI